MEMVANIPVLLCESPLHWENWLGEHYASPRGVWLKLAKKNAGGASVSYAEAVEAALCHGWIDGQKKPYDDAYWLQKFTPRRPRSIWSKVNTDKATQLIEAGRMRPTGLKEVDAAKRDGRWDAAYQSQSKATIPEDFRLELERHPQAKAFFDTLNKFNRYAICHRIEIAKKAETRKARIERFIAMLLANEKLYP